MPDSLSTSNYSSTTHTGVDDNYSSIEARSNYRYSISSSSQISLTNSERNERFLKFVQRSVSFLAMKGIWRDHVLLLHSLIVLSLL